MDVPKMPQDIIAALQCHPLGEPLVIEQSIGLCESRQLVKHGGL